MSNSGGVYDQAWSILKSDDVYDRHGLYPNLVVCMMKHHLCSNLVV